MNCVVRHSKQSIHAVRMCMTSENKQDPFVHIKLAFKFDRLIYFMANGMVIEI